MQRPNAYSTDLRFLIELSENFSEGVIIFDNAVKTILHVNSIGSQITGLVESSSLKDIQRLIDTMPREDQNYVKEQVAHIRKERRCSEMELRLPNESSSLTNICVSAYMLADERFTIVFIRDITKNKRHENYLIEFGTKKNTTLDGVVHFMSGALTLMRNLSLEASKNISAESGNANVYLDLIDKNSSHCLEVVKDLLIEEHDKSPQISVKKSRVNVVDRVNYILSNLKSAYPKRTFKFSHPKREIMAEIDEIKVLQIINNLVFNAIKFSDPETTVTVGVINGSKTFSIYVADSGIGIPSSIKPFIFDRGTLAGRKGLNGEESYGKGLSICKKLAGQMNGDITFESEEDKGSIFYLILPSN